MTGLEALELVYLIKDYFSNMIPYQEWINDIEKYLLKAEKEHKALEIIKKYFDIEFYVENRMNGSIWGRIVYIQSKEDRGQYDSFASANILDYIEEFELLKEVLDNGETMG